MGLLPFGIIRPTERGIVERVGKFKSVVQPGITFLIPFLDDLYIVNTTENMVSAQPQEVITSDNLNVQVDAQVYFKIKNDDESVKSSQYKVNNIYSQIVNLAQTTLRNTVGNMTLKEAVSSRSKLNALLANELRAETKNWGIEIVRTELRDISPPQEVQETMNKVVIALNEKIANKDFAEAQVVKADGDRQAAIKVAEGEKQSAILKAQGKAESIKIEASAEAEAIKLVSESANKNFKGNAVKLKEFETLQNSLQNNSKIIIPTDSKMLNLLNFDSESKK